MLALSNHYSCSLGYYSFPGYVVTEGSLSSYEYYANSSMNYSPSIDRNVYKSGYIGKAYICLDAWQIHDPMSACIV